MNPIKGIEMAEIDQARHNLTIFTYQQAHTRREELGFGWRSSPNAPSGFDELRREFKASQASGLPLRVSSLYCENTMFFAPEANFALRFWHDTNHVRLDADFGHDGEVAVACYQLEALRAAGYPATSLEHRLLHADSFGQTLCVAVIGRYPVNQWRFDLWCLTDGVDEAIAYEFAKLGEAA